MPLQRPSPLVALTDVASRTVAPALLPAAESLFSNLLAPLRGLAFWAAILLPLTYVPMVFGDVGATLGLVGAESHLVVVLLVCNAVAFLIGHGHNLPDES